MREAGVRIGWTHVLEDDIESRESVGSDKEKLVVLSRNRVDISDFASSDQSEVRAVGLVHLKGGKESTRGSERRSASCSLSSYRGV